MQNFHMPLTSYNRGTICTTCHFSPCDALSFIRHSSQHPVSVKIATFRNHVISHTPQSFHPSMKIQSCHSFSILAMYLSAVCLIFLIVFWEISTQRSQSLTPVQCSRPAFQAISMASGSWTLKLKQLYACSDLWKRFPCLARVQLLDYVVLSMINDELLRHISTNENFLQGLKQNVVIRNLLQ